jgi:D-alanine-D-alanine ligase
MKIAIVTDQDRVNFLPGAEGIQEDKQKKETVEYIKKALTNEYDVIALTMNQDLIKNLKNEKVDLVFNLCNGVRGEASLSQLPSLLEMNGISYTASGPLGHGLAYNKIYSGKLFKASNIATPGFTYVNSIEEIEDIKLEFPLLVKPKDEGSSRGIQDNSLLYDKEALINKIEESLSLYNPPIMIMEYIDGKEFTVGVLGNGDNTRILPILEIDFSKLPEGLNKIYSFEVKFKYDDKMVYHIPARIDEDIRKKIEKAAIDAFKSLNLKDYARVDIRVKNGIPYVIEINSLPGLDKYSSDICKMAASAGIGYDELIKEIVEIAIKRNN